MTQNPMNTINALLMLIVISTLGVEAGYAQVDPCSVKREVGGKALDELTWKRLNAIYEDVSSQQLAGRGRKQWLRFPPLWEARAPDSAR